MNEQIFTEERQKEIVALVKKNKKVSVNELSNLFGVSTATIRSDLSFLEERGYLQRTHGGAIPVYGTSYEMTNSEKEKLHIEQKYLIGEYAATLVEDGDTIALDSGTTAMCFAENLKEKKNVTVVTNDLKIAVLFENFENISVVFIGGNIRKGFACSVGNFANTSIRSFNVDKSFITTNTVNSDFECCTPSIPQAEIKKSLFEIGKKRILICDSTKFDKIALVTFASLKDFDLVITDKEIDKKIASEMRKEKINLHII